MDKKEMGIRKINRYERKWKWRKFYFHKILRRHIFEKYFHCDIVMPRYAGRWVYGRKKTNEWIEDKILSGEPFMVARFGNTELQVLVSVLQERVEGKSEKSKKRFEEWFPRLVSGAGFFPDDETLAENFADVLLSACKETDLLAMWHCDMEDYVISEYMENLELTYLTRIEPWRAKNPWSRALKGKRVLVIHPFEESIKSQYARREKLFENDEILPDFELITLKAVQTIAGMRDERFHDWFEALNYMYQEAMKKEFDIAIIGCGAYGMPLAAMIKKAGKQAIHMGGVTQLLFGIKGKRWMESPTVKMDFNNYWVYPSEKETPIQCKMVENGCYWK